MNHKELLDELKCKWKNEDAIQMLNSALNSYADGSTGNSKLLQLKEDNECKGIAVYEMQSNKQRIYIHYLMTAESNHRYGTDIIKSLCHLAYYSKLDLTCHSDMNATGFYEKIGFNHIIANYYVMPIDKINKLYEQI